MFTINAKQTLLDIKASLTLPIIVAPMFLISSPKSIIAGCEAGIITSIPTLNARTANILEDWFEQIKVGLEKLHVNNTSKRIAPWAVNIVHHKFNERYKEDIELIKKYRPPIVITILGNPAEVIREVREYNGIVLSDVATLYHARKAVEAGVDGLILVCSGAGGHGGTLNPFAFIHEVRKFWDGITILAGSLSSGEDILAAEVLGADFVYMGTRFIAIKENNISEEYQKMLVDSTLEDIIYTNVFTGIHANYLIPSVKKVGLDPDRLTKLDSIGPKPWKDIWSAGQGVGAVKEVSTMVELVTTLRQQYVDAFEKLYRSKLNVKNME